MTTTTDTHTVEQVQVLDRRVQYLKDGSGSPLLVLHHSTGNPGWIPLYGRLAEQFTTYVPDLPGYGQSERPEWARSPRDLASILLFMLDELQLPEVAVLGLGLGGWVGAEMAVQQQSRISSLVIVGAPGIQPDEGEIVDQMLIDYSEYVRAGFHDESKYVAEFGEQPEQAIAELWDFSREMTARLSWKPYMFSRVLRHLLPGVQTPTLVVWGEHDTIVPISTGEAYAAALPNGRLERVASAGHLIDLEQPQQLVTLVSGHVGSS